VTKIGLFNPDMSGWSTISASACGAVVVLAPPPAASDSNSTIRSAETMNLLDFMGHFSSESMTAESDYFNEEEIFASELLQVVVS